MLNVGGWELLIILLVALVFLGPQRLPEVARQAGQTVNTLRGLARGFQAELEAAARPDPVPNQNPDPGRDLRAWAGDPDEPEPEVAQGDPEQHEPEPEAAEPAATDPADIADKARQVNHDDTVVPVSDGGPVDLTEPDSGDTAAIEADEEE